MSEYLIARLYVLPGILLGLSLHEFAHAYVAYKLGDSTAKDEGRLTIEPWAHLDFLGFIFFLIAGFGWAKPVPVNSANFKKPRRDEILVSIAGPIMNFLIAVIFAFIMVLCDVNGVFYNSEYLFILYQLMFYTVFINLILALFNLLPIPPLDGSHIIYNILPKKIRHKYMRIFEFQTLILLILFFTNILDYILIIPVENIFYWLMNFIYSLF